MRPYDNFEPDPKLVTKIVFVACGAASMACWAIGPLVLCRSGLDSVFGCMGLSFAASCGFAALTWGSWRLDTELQYRHFMKNMYGKHWKAISMEEERQEYLQHQKQLMEQIYGKQQRR